MCKHACANMCVCARACVCAHLCVSLTMDCLCCCSCGGCRAAVLWRWRAARPLCRQRGREHVWERGGWRPPLLAWRGGKQGAPSSALGVRTVPSTRRRACSGAVQCRSTAWRTAKAGPLSSGGWCHSTDCFSLILQTQWCACLSCGHVCASISGLHTCSRSSPAPQPLWDTGQRVQVSLCTCAFNECVLLPSLCSKAAVHAAPYIPTPELGERRRLGERPMCSCVARRACHSKCARTCVLASKARPAGTVPPR